MDLKAASTRLRRTFAYPSDTTTTSPSSSRHLSPDDDDDVTNGPALDEQEQEELIQALVQQNATRNAQFRLFLLALPALSTIPYILILFSSFSNLLARAGPNNNGNGSEKRRSASGAAADIWIALLALSSLASTAWTLWSLPPGVTGIRALDAWAGSNDPSSSSSQDHISSSRSGSSQALLGPNARRRRASNASSATFWARQQHHRSPLQQYLPFLNVALCALLILVGFLSSSSRRSNSAAAQHWGHVGIANLPALVYVVVLVAKVLMGSIDPERELSALRYEYKGA